MDSDDFDSIRHSFSSISKDLDELSIEAIEDYIKELQCEIERAKQKIEFKRAAKAGADSFFKS